MKSFIAKLVKKSTSASSRDAFYIGIYTSKNVIPAPAFAGVNSGGNPFRIAVMDE
jgi:hypothetical protein